MAAHKGHSKTGGRQKGTPNKITATVRETFERVFQQLQESDTASLSAWGEQNPAEFYRLASKLIPAQMATQGNIVLNVVTGVPEREKEHDTAMRVGTLNVITGVPAPGDRNDLA